MNKEEAIKTLIAVAICTRPILSCGFCPCYKGNKGECEYPSDEQIEQAVKVLHTMTVAHDACLITEDGAVHQLPGVIGMEIIESETEGI